MGAGFPVEGRPHWDASGSNQSTKEGDMRAFINAAAIPFAGLFH